MGCTIKSAMFAKLDGENQESSANFDIENVRPFLQRISQLIESGFNEPQIEQVFQLAEHMKIDEEKGFDFPIKYSGKSANLRVQIFMDDLNSPDIYFFSLPPLAAQIDSEMQRFFEELEI